MSLWLEVFCKKQLGKIQPEALQAGIGKRLTSLTYLYCPDDEEEPEVVLARMKIREEPSQAGLLLIYARKEPEKVLRLQYRPVSASHDAIQEKLERLAHLPNQADPVLKRVRDYLNETQADAAFQIMFSDMQTMAWPVAVAAAAWIAEIGNGIIRTDDGKWMIPDEHDVSYIFNEKP